MKSFAASAAAVLVLSSARQSNALLNVPTSNNIRCASPLVRAPCSRGGTLPLDQLPAASTLTVVSKKKGACSNNSPTVCHYADEWLDASVELAFHGGDTCTAAAAPSPRDAPTLLRRLLLHFGRTWYRLKETIRTKIERCTVYILECEGNKYYVGSTTNRKRRFREHARRKGSKWTRTHKPLRVMKEYRRIPSKFLLGMESKVTAECMLQFGVNNVRGSMFCSPREYHMGDIDALTKFLGHYNNLNFRKVSQRLSQTLPLSPRQLRKKNRYYAYMAGKCFSCGKEGHLAASCPEKKAVTLSP